MRCGKRARVDGPGPTAHCTADESRGPLILFERTSGRDERGGFAIWHDGEAVPPALAGSVVAVGNFDGVHLGHRRLLETAREQADHAGRPSAVLTFDPHPRAFFAPDRPHFDLTPLPVKLKLFAALGLDGAFMKRFDAALAATSPAAFVRDFVLGELGVSGLVVGGDFHFGYGRAGTPALLAELAAAEGVPATIVGMVASEGGAVSSSRIRAALGAGRVGEANGLLGYRWSVVGEVVHGAKLGRTLGYPTANIRLSPGTQLAHGIYAVRAGWDGAVQDGVASFGSRPTFDDGAPLLEVHLFDFAGDLYGRTIEVEFVAWLRAEERFASAEALVAQMDLDSRNARAALASPEGGRVASALAS